MVWEIHCATEAIPVFSITRVLAYRLFFVSIYSLQSEVIEIQSGDMLESCLADTLPPLSLLCFMTVVCQKACA